MYVLVLWQVGSEGCECYDFMLDRWTAIADLPEPVNNCSVAACRGKIYCIGAQYDINDVVLQVYTPEKGIYYNND